MFRSKSKTQRLQDAASDYASTVSDYAGTAADYASSAAATAADLGSRAADKAGPAYDTTRDRLAPAAEAARDRIAPVAAAAANRAADLAGRAQPRVQAGIDAAAPRVDAARHTLVDEVLPRVAGTLATLAAGAASAKATATDAAVRAPDAFAVLKGDAVAKPKGRGRRVLAVVGLAALGAVVFSVIRKNRTKDDPWATPAYTPPSAGRASSLDDKVTDLASAAKDKAAAAGAAAGSVASDAASAVKAKAADARDAVADKVSSVKDRGSSAADGTPALGDSEGLRDTELVGALDSGDANASLGGVGVVSDASGAPGDGGIGDPVIESVPSGAETVDVGERIDTGDVPLVVGDEALPATTEGDDAWTTASDWAEGEGADPSLDPNADESADEVISKTQKSPSTRTRKS